MILFDTNVLLDIATADPLWLPWSEKEFRSAARPGPAPDQRDSGLRAWSFYGRHELLNEGRYRGVVLGDLHRFVADPYQPGIL